MKIYTKTGDKGQSSLLFGSRVDKDDLRLEAFGTVDELNSQLGVLSNHLNDGQTKTFLTGVQSLLFSIGSLFAAEKDQDSLAQLPETAVEDLEVEIDRMSEGLPELRNFILPGGCEAAAQAHVCRTVCRRAERRAVQLQQLHPQKPEPLRYLNRLSDYFFVLARWLNHQEEIGDVIWKG